MLSLNVIGLRDVSSVLIHHGYFEKWIPSFLKEYTESTR